MKLPKWSWLVPLLLLVTWIGARGLDANPLWIDEWWSIYNAGGAHYGPLSPTGIWTRIAAEDAWQAPGYYIALAGWGALVGWSAFAGRAFSLLLGVLTIALIYRAGRDLRAHEAGVGAAAALALSGFFGVYLHEMRAYTSYTLLTVLCAWTYWRIINARRASWFMQAAFLFSVAALLYTHYFAALTAVAVGIYHVLYGGYLLFKRQSLARWWRITGLMIGGGALFLPWFGTAWSLVMNVRETGARRELAYDAATIIQYALFLFSNGSIALLAFIALYGLRRERAVIFVWCVTLSVLALILLINTWLPIVNQMRYIMALFLLIALVVGMGVHRLAQRGVKPAYVTAVWVVAGLIFTLDPRYLADIDKPYNYLPWDALAREIAPYAQPNDTAVMLMPYPAYELVQRDVADYYLYGIPGRYELLESPQSLGVDAYNERASALLNDAGRLWVAYDPQQPPDHEMAFDSLLLSNHVRCGTVSDLPDIRLNLYAPLPATAPYHFGDDIALSQLLPLSVHNELVDVTLGWQVSESVPPDTYSVALHVTDNNGALVAQEDYALPHEALNCHVSFISVSDLGEGEYSVWAIVYNWQSSERLPARNDIQQTEGDRVLLGTFSR